MKYMTSKILMIPVLAVVLTLSAPAASTALACPMCKAANEEDDAKPKAYMYSILFMLAVPATMFTVFGVSFYRLSKSQALLNEEMFAATQADVSNPAENGFPGTGNDS